MKKILATILAAAFGLGAWALTGTGTSTDPFKIATLADLQEFRDSVNASAQNIYKGKYVRLDADIDLNNEPWTPIGNSSATPFSCIFDGNGKTISNLYINDPTMNCAGFIGHTETATITNLKVKNANLTGNDYVGAVAGRAYSVTTVQDCEVSGSIKLSGNHYVGGITGSGYAKVTGCKTIGDGAATSYIRAADAEVNAGDGDDVGGIIGLDEGGTSAIENCHVSDITVEGFRQVGGIAGLIQGGRPVVSCTVKDVVVKCIADQNTVDKKAAKMAFGGIVGAINQSGGSITGCTVEDVQLVSDPVGVSAARMGYVSGGYYPGTEGFLIPDSLSDKITCADNTVNNVVRATEGLQEPAVASRAIDGPSPVAQIGETKYETLQEAINAASAGDTVQLLKDVAIDSALTVEKSITLDLNGFGLEVPDNNNTPIFVNNDATTTLTIVNNNSSTPATLGDADTTKSQYLAKPFAGNIVIGAPNSGAITLTTENIFNQPSGAIGTVTINEGVTVTAGNLYIPAKATTINGGTFNGSVHFSGIENVVTINGGEFKGNVDANSSAAVSSISITGGDFTKNPSPADAPMTVSGGTYHAEIPLKAEYIADGCSVNVGNGNVYEVSTEALDTPAVEVTFEDGKKLYYSTLNSRIFTACDGATVKLLKDIALDDTLGFGSGTDNPSAVTLDLNGHVLSYGGYYDTLSVNPYATVTVRDTSASGNGKITNGYAEGDAVYLSAGASFVLESGTLEATGAGSVGIFTYGGSSDPELPSAKSISITGGAISAASGLIATNGGTVDVEISGGIFSHAPEVSHIVDGYAGGANADAETSGSYPYVVGLVKVFDIVQQAGATETRATYAVTVVVVNDKGETIGTLPDQLTIEVSIAAADVAGSTLAKYDVSKVLDAALASAGNDAFNVTKVEISVVISAPSSGEGTVSYEVHPEAVITVTKNSTDTTSTITLPNACLAADASFTFDLNVTGVVAAGDWAKVTHESADPKYAAEARNLKAVAGDGGKVYVTVTTTHFSTFTIGAGVPPIKFDVRSDNLFGSIKIAENVASNLYVAVPFEGFEADGALRKASNVVHAANLSDGAKMFAYDRTADSGNGAYNVYESESGKWTTPPKVTVTADGKAVVSEADLGYGVAAGTGVILERKSTAETVYVYGQVPMALAESVTFEAGQTLISPPYTNATVTVGGVKYVDMNAFEWTDVAAAKNNRLRTTGADYIQFRDQNNNQIRYFYLEDGGWGLPPTQARKYPQYVAEGKALIPVGTAFWYWSKSGGAKVTW